MPIPNPWLVFTSTLALAVTEEQKQRKGTVYLLRYVSHKQTRDHLLKFGHLKKNKHS